MSKFSIRLSDKISPAPIKLFKLVTNKTCQIDDFEARICREGGLDREVDKIYAVLDKVCNLKMLPKTMFRLIQLRDLPYQLYEAKSANLRFYLIKLEKTGKVILLGGRKSNQKADLKSLVKLVKNIHFEGISNINNP
ncbi:hypothetical protein LZD49_17640 [Dyadobacter sp. CY261]|uniref:hypothetical protein n=1 Tax=Dyadobacter sp. CY261 TaxID=2907203 RepID=UPI001F2519BC|nr:hypothetical protein [Dyadobacter sp. CY261]MCF0072308.1 hypothetical protein [Dyadobacter sp. CY261]